MVTGKLFAHEIIITLHMKIKENIFQEVWKRDNKRIRINYRIDVFSISNTVLYDYYHVVIYDI